MYSTKNVILNWYSSMKKNWEIFWWFLTEKMTLEIKFWHFLHLPSPYNTNSQNSIISFWYDFQAKTFTILYSRTWNFIIGIVIVLGQYWWDTLKCKMFDQNIWPTAYFDKLYCEMLMKYTYLQASNHTDPDPIVSKSNSREPWETYLRKVLL